MVVSYFLYIFSFLLSLKLFYVFYLCYIIKRKKSRFVHFSINRNKQSRLSSEKCCAIRLFNSTVDKRINHKDELSARLNLLQKIGIKKYVKRKFIYCTYFWVWLFKSWYFYNRFFLIFLIWNLVIFKNLLNKKQLKNNKLYKSFLLNHWKDFSN